MNVGRILGLTITVVTAAAASICGCASDGSEHETGGAGGNGGSNGSAGTAGTSGTSGGNGENNAEVRIAHLSPDAPAIDVCLLRSGQTQFEGPVMSELDTPAGLAYAQVTKYIPVHEGTYTVRLIAVGAKCDTALAGTIDATGVELGANDRTTIALLGEMAPPDQNTQALQVKAFTDETETPAGKGRLTFIHASPDAPPVDVGIEVGADFTAVFQNVAFGMKGEIGAARYYETDPLTAVTLGVRPSGTTNDVITLLDVNVPAGTILTVFGIGNVNGAPKPLASLLCVDSTKPSDAFSVCDISP